MTPSLILFFSLAALLELDTTYAFQLMLSRGIVAGPLLSLLTGDLAAGIQVGVFTELLFSDINPLGSVLPPSATVCCAISLALNVLGVPLYFAFVAGVLGAWLFSYAEKGMRKIRVRRVVFWEQRIMQHPSEIIYVVLGSLGTSFAVNFLLISGVVLLFSKILVPFVPAIPLRAHMACQFAYIAVPWIGLATLIPQFKWRKGGR